jgi:hypothetical protein
MATLTIEQAKKMIKTKEHLYKAMQRNDFYLPKYKSTIITEDYLMKVILTFNDIGSKRRILLS